MFSGGGLDPCGGQVFIGSTFIGGNERACLSPGRGSVKAYLYGGRERATIKANFYGRRERATIKANFYGRRERATIKAHPATPRHPRPYGKSTYGKGGKGSFSGRVSRLGLCPGGLQAPVGSAVVQKCHIYISGRLAIVGNNQAVIVGEGTDDAGLNLFGGT